MFRNSGDLHITHFSISYKPLFAFTNLENRSEEEIYEQEVYMKSLEVFRIESICVNASKISINPPHVFGVEGGLPLDATISITISLLSLMQWY